MSEPAGRKKQTAAVHGTAAAPANLNSLVAALSSDDGTVRQNARHSLVTIGRPAVKLLIAALKDRNLTTHWEAAKALVEIRDPASADALVSALEDKEFGVRWVAAEGLIELGRDGLATLLHALTERPTSVWLHEHAHQVLHELANRGLRDLLAPVLAALEGVEPEATVPTAARATLDKLNELKKGGSRFPG